VAGSGVGAFDRGRCRALRRSVARPAGGPVRHRTVSAAGRASGPRVIQLRTLEQRLEDDLLKQREIVDRNREALGLRTENEAKAKSQIAMAEGKIRTLEERASQRRAAIARSAELRAEEEELALAVIEVLP